MWNILLAHGLAADEQMRRMLVLVVGKMCACIQAATGIGQLCRTHGVMGRKGELEGRYCLFSLLKDKQTQQNG